MTPEEALEAQRLQEALLKEYRVRSRALDDVDWSACNDALDGVRRAARDAVDVTSNVDSAKTDYQQCRQFPETFDLLRDRCQSQRSEYESEKQNAQSAIDLVVSRYRRMQDSCGGVAR
jgi:hypothetical protein